MARGSFLGGVAGGLGTGLEYARQRRLDEINAAAQAQRFDLERAAQARLERQAERRQALDARQLGLSERDLALRERAHTEGAAEKRREAAARALLRPWDAFERDPELGAMVPDLVGRAGALARRYEDVPAMAEIEPYDRVSGKGGVGLEDLPNVREGIETLNEELQREASARVAPVVGERMALKRLFAKVAEQNAAKGAARSSGSSGDAPPHGAPGPATARAGKPLPSPMLKELLSADDALWAIDRIRTNKAGVDTGPATSAKLWASGIVGYETPAIAKEQAFRAEVGDQLSRYIKSISGAVVTDKEAARLIANLPTIRDNDLTFGEKLRSVMESLEAHRRRHVERMAEAGYDTSRFTDWPRFREGAAAPSAAWPDSARAPAQPPARPNSFRPE